MNWHPWRWALHHHPHTPITICALPDDLDGAWTTQGIFLSDRLGQTGRRVTLTHELVHLHRGPAVHGIPHIEERAVDALTARLLIPLERLADALAWCGWQANDECAEELWVDLPTLLDRIAGLTPIEREWLESKAR